MDINLNIVSWNATGIMSSMTYLCNLLFHRNIDICGISEHWLFEKDLHFLEQVDSNYRSHAVSDASLQIPGRRRVGKGGVAILWHKKYDRNITPLSLDDDRIIGIKFVVNSSLSIYFFQMYLPCSNHALCVYKEYVGRLYNIISLYSENGIVILMGDMNINLLPGSSGNSSSNRSKCFMKFLQETSMLSVNKLEHCCGPKSTFVSYDNTTETCIDHIIFPSDKLHYVVGCKILDDDCLNVSRHRPVLCSVKIPNFDIVEPVCAQPSINWKKVTDNSIIAYQEILGHNENLQYLVNNEMNCKTAIDQAYSVLVNEIKNSAQKCFPSKRFKSYLKPYWNAELSALHCIMRQKRAMWIQNGRPRGNNFVSYREYKAAKCKFRKKHRCSVEVYLQKQTEEIDKLAEIDSGLFWRLVNSRRKKARAALGSDLNFNGRIVSSPQDITREWGEYFKSLYKPSEDIRFDDNHKHEISNRLKIINDSLLLPEPPVICADEVHAATRLAKRGKAGGDDCIVYEHIEFGGEILYKLLAKFFTALIRLSYAPSEMKKGIIITLYKGGNKRKDNPDSYRAITLSSVILKLFERILLTRIQLFSRIQPPIHRLQGGFQKDLGCLMTSFMFREAIHFAKENNSRLYVCFLDVQKAFDCVWHDGLFYKLYCSGVDHYIYKVLFSLYSGMTSCVKYQGYKSDWFPILQGTRQGGVISPFLYLIFINELLYKLQESNLGLCFVDIFLGSPSVADDMLLCSYSKAGLDGMLRICFAYSQLWRYLYNAKKCSVVVFNEKKSDFRRSNRNWKLGNDPIKEADAYKHLGVLCDKYMYLDGVVKEACNKIKSTFLSIINCGLHEDGLNPITAYRIYQSVVLPKALYGSELWSGLLPNQLLQIERAHRFCIKFMQSLPRSTSTDVALGLLGAYDIETEIDRRKLLFFGQLCRLSCDLCVKDFFIHRFVHFSESEFKQLGYFPDIYRILCKYSLSHVFQRFKDHGTFMSKQLWKRQVREKINIFNRNRLLEKASYSDSARHLLRLHNPSSAYIIWKICKEFPYCYSGGKLAVRLIGSMFDGRRYRPCSLCTILTPNLTEHTLLFCRKTDDFRTKLWKKLIYRFGIGFFCKFITMSSEEQIDSLFSGCNTVLVDESEKVEFLKIFLLVLKTLRLPTVPVTI